MGFSRFPLSPSLQKSILNLGYAEPTPIQAHVIPDALKGRDIRACAQTGTGKTCAFLIPIIENLIKHEPSHRPSVLILTPTRELAAQVHQVANDLSKGERIRTALILGGMNINTQSNQLRQGADIVVATPGRLLDLANRKVVSLHHVRTYVMDEADRMLDMGFLPDIRRITAQIPRARQTMLFSATFGPGVKELTHQFLINPVVVELSPSNTATSANVTQMVYPVPQAQKKAILQAILELGNMTSALIFTRTKHGANKLLIQLREWGKKAAVIHSNRSQSQRQQALQGFKNGQYQILVATDIAARGIDVKDISHVINYDVPRHAEDYVHRIGRTGRAQAVGEAFTLVSPDEEVWLKKIESFIRKTLPRTVIPDFPYQSKPRIMPAPSHPQPSHHHHKPSPKPSQHHHQNQSSSQEVHFRHHRKQHGRHAHHHKSRPFPSEHRHREQNHPAQDSKFHHHSKHHDRQKTHSSFNDRPSRTPHEPSFHQRSNQPQRHDDLRNRPWQRQKFTPSQHRSKDRHNAPSFFDNRNPNRPQSHHRSNPPQPKPQNGSGHPSSRPSHFQDHPNKHSKRRFHWQRRHR